MEKMLFDLFDFQKFSGSERLAEALEQLNEREQDIIILHYYNGRTLKEIAQDMEISYSYIKLLHTNALKTMKNYFDQ